MNRKKWVILSSDYLIKNKWLTVRKDYVQLPTGVEMGDYYVLEYPDWVTVIAITEEGKYVMIRQYRHGLQETYFELCGGTVEKEENPLETAKRELLEETGYEGGDWSFFTTTSPNPAAMTNVCHTYIANGVKKVRDQELEATEDIEALEMTSSQLLKVMADGLISQGDMLAPLWRWMYNNRIE